MKLVICPKCLELVDIDKIKVLEPNDIVGCGQKEDDFVYVMNVERSMVQKSVRS